MDDVWDDAVLCNCTTKTYAFTRKWLFIWWVKHAEDTTLETIRMGKKGQNLFFFGCSIGFDDLSIFTSVSFSKQTDVYCWLQQSQQAC